MITVMKFGGTSLSSKTKRMMAYGHIEEALKEGKVVVVVSAFGRYPSPYASDTLLHMGSPLLSKKEKARLISIGEQCAALRVCGELLERNHQVCSLSIRESGIYSDDTYEYAKVLYMENKYLLEALKHHDIVVVCGFLAYSLKQEITTLGRGGSDFSAVLYADMLNLDEVSIFSDVEGVYDRDPKIYEQCKKYDVLDYDEILNMKAKVLHARSIIYAKEHGIKIHVRSTFSKNNGTWIKSEDKM